MKGANNDTFYDFGCFHCAKFCTLLMSMLVVVSLGTLQGVRPPLGGASEREEARRGEIGPHSHAGCATHTHLRRVVNQACWRLKARLCQTKGERPPAVRKELERAGLPPNYFSPNRFTSPTEAKERRPDLRKIREFTAKPPQARENHLKGQPSPCPLPLLCFTQEP